MKRLISLLTLFCLLMTSVKATGQRIQVGEMTVPDKGQLRISIPGNNANVKTNPVSKIYFSFTCQAKFLFPPSFSNVHPFREGMALFKKGDKELKGQFGFINKKGGVVISPAFDQVGTFKDGKCSVWINGGQFYVNKKGEKI